MVATYDGSAAVAGMKIFLNGVQVNDASSASVGADTYNKMRQSSDLIQIGADEGALLFDGTIYNITLHKRVFRITSYNVCYTKLLRTEVEIAPGNSFLLKKLLKTVDSPYGRIFGILNNEMASML